MGDRRLGTGEFFAERETVLKIETVFLDNFLIIPNARLTIHPEMTAITGETGSGKSLFVSALTLLRGERASRKIVGPWKNSAELSAVIMLEKSDASLKKALQELSLIEDNSDEVIIRRIIGARNAHFINDKPVALATLHRLFASHLEISSQFENREISKKEYQISVLDRECGVGDTLEVYKKHFERWQLLKQEITRLEERDNPGRRDYLEFQIEEIEHIDPKAEEEKELEQRLFILENARKLALLRHSLHETLSAAETALSSAFRDAEQLEEIVGNTGVSERIDSVLIEVNDLERSAVDSSFNDREDEAFSEEETRNRLDTIRTLLNKHRCQTVAELLDLYAHMEDELRRLYDVPDTVDRLKKERDEVERELLRVADEIHRTRESYAPDLSEKIRHNLEELGMAGVRFSVSVTRAEQPNAFGVSTVSFLVNTVGGTHLEPVSSLSGGELSRLLLVLKLLDRESGKVILFDEIDSNIGGETASKAAVRLEENAKLNQVLVVTHLPQTAARASSHLVVAKSVDNDGVTAAITAVSGEKRITELARMMGDASLDAHRDAAAILLEKQDDAVQ